MITVADVVTQVNTMLTAKFPNIDITFTDNPTGKTIPAFYTTVFSNTINKISIEETQKKLGIKIYYFPSNEYDYLEELCSIQEECNNLFASGFPIQDIYVDLGEDGIDNTIIDGVLQILFYINYKVYTDNDDEYDYMGDLDNEEDYNI